MVPRGWHVCDGSEQDVNDPNFQALNRVIGTIWGGDNVSKFRLPDLRGRFLRGVDQGAGRDPDSAARSYSAPGATNPGARGDTVGSLQEDAFQVHHHRTGYSQLNLVGSNSSRDADGGDEKWNSDPHLRSLQVNVLEPTDGGGGSPRLAAETRPQNATVYWIIKCR